MKNQCEVVVINLAHRRDRAERIQRHLDFHGIEFKFHHQPRVMEADVPAAELVCMQYKENTVPLEDRARYAAAAYGCKMAHLEVLLRARVRNKTSLVILEDDCEFIDVRNLNFMLGSELNQMMNWDQVYFSGYCFPPTDPSLSSFVKIPVACWNLTAVRYSHDGIRAVSDMLLKYAGEADEILATCYHPNAKRSYIANPPLTRQIAGFSDIENREVGMKI